MQRNSVSRALLILVLAVGLAAGGCAAGAEGERRGNANVLTAEAMQAASVANLYDAVEQLRPRWLQARGGPSLSGAMPAIGVFMNRVYQGDPEVLRSLPIAGVAQLRYMDGPTASAQLRTPGSTALAGAIIIEMQTASGPGS